MLLLPLVNVRMRQTPETISIRSDNSKATGGTPDEKVDVGGYAKHHYPTIFLVP
jgi:hypothetical protein